ANVRENLVDLAGAAGAYVVNPSVVLGQMDFYPLVGKCQGPPLDLSAVSSELDYDRDFNWTTKGSFTFRGAYVGEGTNPGFQLAADVKPSGVGATPGVDAGTGPDAGAQTGGSGGTTSGAGGAFAAGGAIASGGGSATVSGGGSAGNAAIGSTGSTDKGGCGCRMQRRSSAPLRFAHGYLLLICLLRKARRRRQEKAEEDALPTHDHFMEPVS
ncbi:MAG TPA: hypothetical protein VGJ84_11075, partial [Polyangiaceae bacterium]